MQQSGSMSLLTSLKAMLRRSADSADGPQAGTGQLHIDGFLCGMGVSNLAVYAAAPCVG